jgi:hypothetical protein
MNIERLIRTPRAGEQLMAIARAARNSEGDVSFAVIDELERLVDRVNSGRLAYLEALVEETGVERRKNEADEKARTDATMADIRAKVAAAEAKGASTAPTFKPKIVRTSKAN